MDLTIGFRERYPNIPEDYLLFLQGLTSLVNADDTAWFNSLADFNTVDEDAAFLWNEFETQSLAAFEGDTAMQAEVSAFWNQHIPFLLSVKNGYAHFSIGVAPHNFGQVFFGCEPEYEDVTWLAPSFTAFLDLMNSNALDDKFAAYL